MASPMVSTTLLRAIGTSSISRCRSNAHAISAPETVKKAGLSGACGEPSTPCRFTHTLPGTGTSAASMMVTSWRRNGPRARTQARTSIASEKVSRA